jgi:hypothetical protein
MLDSLIKIDRRLGYLDRALPTKSRQATTPINPAETRYDPGLYIRRHLGWRPWRGTPGHPGQQEVLDAYTLALRQMHERELYEQGKVRAEDLRHWAPGRVIKNRIRIEAGHTVGKTKLAAGLVNHFIDHFWPAVAYTFAPTWEQIKSLLWKEIKSDRRGKGLPGRILDTCEIQISDNHFAKGKSTSDDHGRGTERIQGQHERYLLLVMDEAEGVADFVFDAIDSMESGGIVVVIMLANPRTRTSRFHKAAANSDTRSFRISCLHHPNVVAGREVVPGTVRRQYVEKMIEKHCRVAPRHNPDDHTFELPFEVRLEGRVLPAGTIFLPDSEFMFRVMGEAPANTSDKSLVPTGRYDAAARRPAPREASHAARIGVDVAGFGNDKGTIYVRHGDLCWRAHQLSKLDQVEYYQHVKAECFKLARKGVTSLRAHRRRRRIRRGRGRAPQKGRGPAPVVPRLRRARGRLQRLAPRPEGLRRQDHGAHGGRGRGPPRPLARAAPRGTPDRSHRARVRLGDQGGPLGEEARRQEALPRSPAPAPEPRRRRRVRPGRRARSRRRAPSHEEV